MKKSISVSRMTVYSLKALASLLDIPGGVDAMERLLLAAGFLTGAYRSENPHLPYQRYLNLGYFLVTERDAPRKRMALTFCVTNRGLAPVLKKLQEFGIQMKFPDDL